MKIDLAKIRNDYTLNGLQRADLSQNPLDQFQKWFSEVLSAEITEANAMVLSTSVNHRPSGRIVLLKGLDAYGFVFFTNYLSQKGTAIAHNPLVSLTFFWKELERQVRIEGKVEKLSESDSDEYFHSRPRGSQLGAWVSHQSEVIDSREVLDRKLVEIEKRFEGQPIPRPSHWGGYRLLPDYAEFWQGRPSRLHDRFAYELDKNGNWSISRLSP
ncbi:pyridoxamine 5'-phosphate oxidase [Dyadobacter tibetensis]|uniref:pyridoxamine 5'-phosphate oxidase n=1 Tax=Dyadobacter tibetensis TaxID=1211851 RepID=UPI00046F9BB3|nr:pyridoxamine 5'-phosphate oxidase [Dyadobacter tibetensis]